MAKAKKTAGNGDQRDQSGRFVPGGPGGPGRPKGISFRRLVTEQEGEEGVAKTLMRVYRILGKLATETGDVQAAKILIDKLCLADAIDLQLNVTADDAPIEQIADEVANMLRAAEERRAAAAKGRKARKRKP